MLRCIENQVAVANTHLTEDNQKKVRITEEVTYVVSLFFRLIAK